MHDLAELQRVIILPAKVEFGFFELQAVAPDQLAELPVSYPSPPLTLSGRYLTPQEVVVMASLYWPYLELMHVLAVAQRESGLWTAAWNLNPGVEDSRGILQINVDAWTAYRVWNLWDPNLALYFGAVIYRAEGWRPWYMAKPPYLPWL